VLELRTGARQGDIEMKESRRKFVTTVFTAGVPLGILAGSLLAQAPVVRPPHDPDTKDDQPSPLKPDPKLVLEENQKNIKKNVERLYELASELKAEVEKTDNVQVLSLTMLKKTEDIEKLAKEIRSRAKG
jgi:hypothetical protein